MHRVDTPTATAAMPAPEPEGTPGYFTKGDPVGGLPATAPGPDMLNMLQEELVAILTAFGVTPDQTKQDYGQIATALLANFANIGGNASQLFKVLAASQDNDAVNLGQLMSLLGVAAPVGSQTTFPATSPPTGWLVRDGGAYSMTSYEALYDFLGSMFGLDTGTAITLDNATDTANLVAHGLADDTILELSNSGGALPAELAVKTKYYVVNAGADTFQLSLTKGGAVVAFTSDGTGTHNSHTKFKLADDRGLFERGWDNGAGVDPDAASRGDRGDGTTGDNVGTPQDDENKLHKHDFKNEYDTVLGVNGFVALSDENSEGLDMATGAGARCFTYLRIQNSGGNEARPQNRAYLPCIKY